MAIGGHCEQIDTSLSVSTSVSVRVQVYSCSVAVWGTEITSHTVLDILRVWNRYAADLVIYCTEYANYDFTMKKAFIKWLLMPLLQILYCIIFSHNWPLNKLNQRNNAFISAKSSHCLFFTRFLPVEALKLQQSPCQEAQPHCPNIPVCARASCRMDLAVNAPRPLWRAPLTFEENPQTSATLL